MQNASTIFGALYSRLPIVGAVVVGALGAGVYFAGRAPAEFVSKASLMIPTDPPAMSLTSEGANLPKGPMVPDRSEDLRIGLLGVVNSGAVHRRVEQRLLAEGFPNVSYSGLRKNIVGDIGRDSHLAILAYGRTKERSAMIANTFLEELEKELQSLAEQGPARTLEAMVVEEPRAWALYEDRNTDLIDFLDGLGSSGLEFDAVQLLEQRREVQRGLFELSIRDGVARAELPVLERLLAERMPSGETPFLTSSRNLERNSAYQRALEDAESKAVELAQARLIYRDPHPEIQRLLVELEHAEERVRSEAEDEMIESSITLSLDEQTVQLLGRLVEAQIAESSFEPQRVLLEARAAQIDEELSRMPAYHAREAALREKVVIAREYADKLSRRRVELQFHVQRGLAFSVTDEAYRASPENAQAVPSQAGILVFSGLAGIVVGVMLALVLEMLAQMRVRAPY